MCAINGLIGFAEALAHLRRMNSLTSHRGPDAEGEWSHPEGRVAFGHRRLSIIDLSAEANQPFVKDGLAIVYNGEVYNFPELKEGLIREGIHFRSRSDTEVIIELFRKYRHDAFSRLLGMFALCIYDIASGELFLARDHFGIKPLYYTVLKDERLVFSSELKAILSVPGISREINRKALVASVNYLWPYGTDSIFKGVYKVPPAHYLRIRTSGDTRLTLEQKRYWRLSPQQTALSGRQLEDRLGEVLENSVRRHLIADVQVGAFLSGGLDSSLVCAIARKSIQDLATFTITIGGREKRIEKMPDDTAYARMVSRLLDTRHTDVLVKPDAVSSLKEMVYALDEPIGDPAAINTYLICKLARENGIKVLLSGMGADELFGGYRRQYATLLANRFKALPAWVRRGAAGIAGALPVRIGSRGLKTFRWLKRFATFSGLPLEQAYMRSYSYYDRQELSRLLRFACESEIEEIYADHRERFFELKDFDDLNKMCYTDICMFMEALNLTYSDRASMAASVEVRVPYIDREVVELAMSIPAEYKIRNSVSKYILKRVAQRYLPDKIVFRAKASFSMPIRAWISGELRPFTDELLSEATIRKRGIFDPDLVRSIILRDRKGLEDNAYRIYQFLTLELWFRRYLDS